MAAEPTPAADAEMALARHLEGTRAFVRDLAAAAPTVPDQLGRAWGRVAGEMQARGPLGIVLLLAVFAALGFGLEWLFWWATAGFRRWMIGVELTTPEERLRAVGLRTGYGLGVLLAFALGSIGGFLLFDWPPLLKQIVLTYLSLVLIVRLVLVLGRILLAPAAERFRVLPMATPTARFWFVWTALLVGWFFFVRFSLDLLDMLGMTRPAQFVVGMSAGIALLGMALFVVWRHPDAGTGQSVHGGHRLGSWALSLYLVAVWLLLFTGSATPFYIGVVLLLLPIVIRSSNRAVNHLLRPAEDEPRPPGCGIAAGRAAGARLAGGPADRRRLPDRRHPEARHGSR